MKFTIIFLISIFLSGCQNGEYSLMSIPKEAKNNYFDSDGNMWIKPYILVDGREVMSTEAIINNVIPFCFLTRKSIFNFIEKIPSYQNGETSIYWYGRATSSKEGEVLLFGEYGDKEYVKIGDKVYGNKKTPKGEIFKIVDECQLVQNKQEWKKGY